MKKKKILTWHVHGTYLYYLTQANCDFYLPFNDERSEGYGGRSGSFPWGSNVHEVHVSDVKNLDIDGILFQSRRNFEIDQYEILSERQRMLPKVYLEHDPPRESPTETKHIVSDKSILLVHVTHFNNLMWDSNNTPTRVIEHGVVIPDVSYSGEIPRGIVVVNNIQKRGRRLGYDIFEQIRKIIPLDIAGMGSKELGGLGDISHDELIKKIATYRFFFNPIRYTSLGLAVCEAMMAGTPVVGLATTEMARTIINGETGYIDTDIDVLITHMKDLINNHKLAKEISIKERKYAYNQFSINRFSQDWEQLFASI